jgi:antagonist of KipI
MLGRHLGHFDAMAVEALCRSRYTITPQSNRMGYRLAGAPLSVRADVDVISEATPLGTIQVPPSGLPIVLMADRATTGGYPQIGTVITADIPAAGQLAPGDWIEFSRCERRDAMAALREQEAALAAGGV